MMTTKEMADRLNLTLISEGDILRNVTGVYICDLLSHVMSKAKSGDAWITVMTNINIIAVASLAELSCIIIPESISVEDETVIKARQEGISIFSSHLSAYELACLLKECI